MNKITAEGEISNPLTMLFAYSAFFGIELCALVGAIHNYSVFHENEKMFSFLGDNYPLIFIPVLIYLAVSRKNLLIRFAYFLGILPIILSLSYFSTITGTIYIRILTIFIVNVCLIRYINQVFILYKNIAIQNSGMPESGPNECKSNQDNAL